jgi:hypothetical protein
MSEKRSSFHSPATLTFPSLKRLGYVFSAYPEIKSGYALSGEIKAYPKIPYWCRKSPGERFNAGLFRHLGYNFGICSKTATPQGTLEKALVFKLFTLAAPGGRLCCPNEQNQQMFSLKSCA